MHLKFWRKCKMIMSRSTLDYYISVLAHLPDLRARGPLSFPLLVLLQMDREYCVALVYKQAPRLFLASSTHEWMILYLWLSFRVNTRNLHDQGISREISSRLL